MLFTTDHPRTVTQDAKLRECATLFQKADADNSGDVSIEELDRYFKLAGSGKTPAALKALVALVDDDNTGTLRFSECVWRV
jgi:Ca2+-binding EF-hand superfamily protein